MYEREMLITHPRWLPIRDEIGPHGVGALCPPHLSRYLASLCMKFLGTLPQKNKSMLSMHTYLAQEAQTNAQEGSD